MSNKALTWAFETDLPTVQKFVLVALADKADERHSCFPGQKMIAQMIGGGERTVRRALADLEAQGFIAREERRAADGYRTSDRYVLAVDQVLPAAAAGSSHRPLTTVSPAADDSLTGRSGRAIEPSVNPKGNPQRRGTRIPEPFVVDEQMRVWARAEAPSVDLVVETKNFADHWATQSGSKGVKLDWGRVWQTWMRRQHGWNVEKGWKPEARVQDVTVQQAAEQKAAWCAARGITVEKWDGMTNEERLKFAAKFERVSA